MNSSSKLKQHSLSSFLMDDKKMDTTKNKQNLSKHEDLNTLTFDFYDNKALLHKLVKRESFTQKMFKSWSSKRMQEINRNKMAQETVEERKKRYGGFTNAIDAAIANVDKKFPKKEEKEKTTKTNLEKSKNVREQRKRIFGTDPNAPRLSDKRIKMMQAIRDYAQKKYGLDLKIAQGKRDAFGKIREDKDNQPAYDVFSPSGVLKEKALLEQYKKSGKKRTDPKPDWRSGNLETQPNPDAAIHELAHLNLAPEHTSLPQIQEEMDRQWGESQKKYGHLQQKKTRGEVQPMSIENPIRREIGLPANRSTKRVTQNQDVLDDPGQKRFVQGKDLKGKTVFYDRQSRLQNPETRERMRQIREGSLKFNPQTGWEKASDVNALINLRARGKYEEALKRIKERVGFNKMPKKLAASELKKTPIEYDEAEAHYLGDTYLASPSKQFGQYRHIATYSVGPDKFHHIYNDTLNNEIIHQLTDSESPWRAKNVFSDIVGKLRNDGSLQITTASVDPEHKGKGYGKTLYAQALAYHGKIHSDELVSRMANKVYSYLKDIGAKVKMGAPNTRERHEAVSTPEMKQKIGWKDDEELAASEKFCKVSSPKKGHTIAQLERLKQDNWYNPDTGTELDAEEAERYLWQMRQNKADKKVARTLRALKEPKKSNEKPEDWFGDSELSKMSRPRITFPNLKRITTRPDQEVQLIESGRQKDILGRKIVQSFLKDPKERQKIANLSPKQKEKVYADNAKYHTAKFSNKTLGFMSPTPSGPISSTLAGKLRSKFEEGDEKDQAKLDAWKQKRAEIINNYHEAIEKWRQEGQNLTGEALSEHLKKRPQKPKLPRRPSKSLKATKDLPRDRMEARGRSLSATIEHEGFHHILDQIKNQYGPIAQQKVRDKLLEQHDPEAIKHLSAYVQHGLGYKPNSFFNEELLAHARDILVNPKKRQNFKKFIQTSMYGTLNFSDEDFTNLISKLKRGHQKAYQVAQNLKEEDLLVPGQSVTKSSITKEEQPLDVNFPDEISLKYATHRWEK